MCQGIGESRDFGLPRPALPLCRGRWSGPRDRAGRPDTGGDENAAHVGVALHRIIKLLGEAAAGRKHIVRLNWYLISRYWSC
jgi:hypothetical protein